MFILTNWVSLFKVITKTAEENVAPGDLSLVQRLT